MPHKRHTQRLQALVDFSSRFVEVRSEEELLAVLFDLLYSMLDFQHASVFLRRQDGSMDEVFVYEGQLRYTKTDFSRNGRHTRLNEVLQGEKPYFLSQDTLREVSEEERQVWMRLLPEGERRAFGNALVPIRGRTQVLGVLAVDRRDTGEPITQSEISMLLTIGRYAGLALDNVYLLQELRAAEERLLHLVQSLPVAIWEVNLEKRRLDFVSGYVEQWLGYTPEEWLRTPGLYRSVVHPDDIEVFHRVIYPSSEASPCPIEIRLRDREGKWHWCRIHWALVQEKGRAPVVRGVTTDITPQKQAELQQLHLMRLRSLGEIASGVAHNFNNLLMGILGNAELLQTALQHDPELQRRAEVIIQLAQDASAILRRMQGFYKQQPSPRREKVRLQALLEDVVESTRPIWYDRPERHGAEIQMSLRFEADPVVEANRSELVEVFTNLILNACDAMPQGGTITISLREENGNAVVQVADTGIGMPPEVRERCFEAFFTTKGEEGSGLGLSVSYQIVSRHSGQISVWSEVGKGSIFSVILPVARESEPMRQETPPLLPESALRILMVDDDEAVRTAIQHLLEADGHRVQAAPTAETALTEFQRERYDLVILDLGMPHMDGLSLARRLKDLSPNIPIILLTGWGEQVREDRPPEVDTVLAKPVRRSTLRSAIAQLVRR
ncbi:MAG: response regulator [Armatimonadetes bacterium]|nr:response regulator [Armatimonadota bacterium]